MYEYWVAGGVYVRLRSNSKRDDREEKVDKRRTKTIGIEWRVLARADFSVLLLPVYILEASAELHCDGNMWSGSRRGKGGRKKGRRGRKQNHQTRLRMRVRDRGQF